MSARSPREVRGGVVVFGTWAGLKIGDWATWATAFTGFAAFGAVVVGLFVEGARRRADIARLDAQRHWDQISAQARQVGGYLRWPGPGTHRLEMVVTNASDLPVRNVVGHIFRRSDGLYAGRFVPVPVLPPGTQPVHLEVTPGEQYGLQLQFDDDAGQTWVKYGDPPLMLVDETHPVPTEAQNRKP